MDIRRLEKAHCINFGHILSISWCTKPWWGFRSLGPTVFAVFIYHLSALSHWYDNVTTSRIRNRISPGYSLNYEYILIGCTVLSKLGWALDLSKLLNESSGVKLKQPEFNTSTQTAGTHSLPHTVLKDFIGFIWVETWDIHPQSYFSKHYQHPLHRSTERRPPRRWNC